MVDGRDRLIRRPPSGVVSEPSIQTPKENQWAIEGFSYPVSCSAVFNWCPHHWPIRIHEFWIHWSVARRDKKLKLSDKFHWFLHSVSFRRGWRSISATGPKRGWHLGASRCCKRYLWSQKERHCWTHLCFSQLRHSNTALKRRVCNWSSGLNAWHCSIVAQFESCASVSQVIWPESFEVPRLVAFECPTLFTPSKSFTRTDLRSSQAKRPKAWRELMLQLLRHWNHWCGTKSHPSNIPTNHAKATICLLNCKDMQRHSLPVFIRFGNLEPAVFESRFL